MARFFFFCSPRREGCWALGMADGVSVYSMSEASLTPFEGWLGYKDVECSPCLRRARSGNCHLLNSLEITIAVDQLASELPDSLF